MSRTSLGLKMLDQDHKILAKVSTTSRPRSMVSILDSETPVMRSCTPLECQMVPRPAVARSTRLRRLESNVDRLYNIHAGKPVSSTRPILAETAIATDRGQRAVVAIMEASR